MKKIHYSSIAIIALTVFVSAGVAHAQAEATTSAPNSRWSNYFEQRQKNLEQRKEKLASTTEKIKAGINEREARLASSTAKFGALKERIASSTAARKAKLEERFKTGVSNKIATVVDRLGDALNRIKDIDSRITSRIEKLKRENVDTSKAEALLSDAQAQLKIATDKVSALESSVSSVLTENVSTSTKTTIKSKIVEVNTSVKAVHAAYVKVVENLKPGKETSTTTATTTAQ